MGDAPWGCHRHRDAVARAPRSLGRPQAQRIIDETEFVWSGAPLKYQSCDEFRRVRSFLEKPAGASQKCVPNATAPGQLRRSTALRIALRDARLLITTRAIRGPLPNGIFVHVSHTGLQHGPRFGTLLSGGLPAIFFVHDLIPIETPEFCRPGENAKHEKRMHTVANHASVVVVNSKTTQLSFREHCKRRGWRQPPIEVIPIGVDPAFARNASVPMMPSSTLYFVVLGTIEPRKNHLLLLHVWRRLAQLLGSRTPRLVIIGRRGWENENACDLLERSELIRDHVIEAANLADRHVVELIRGAAALLAPSFIEGYGMQVAEALSAGTPVIASDIPAHREAAGSFAEFIDPLDAHRWLAAVTARLEEKDESQSGLGVRYVPFSWSDHFAALEYVIQSIGSAKQSGLN